MAIEIGDSAMARRSLVLRDTVSLLTILAVTAVLFACTLFLFRSFSTHRAELAQRWSDRGRRALQANKPQEAIADLRTALLYAPGDRAFELLLAEALGQAGRTDESLNYFLGLWDTMPGDGNINLSLARLAARKGNRTDAVRYYRAATDGTWPQGDGVQRRASVRAELAQYLIEQHDLQSARMELLIAGSNSPDNYDRDMTFGHLFETAQDPGNARVYYEKAISLRPHDAAALEAAGRLAYQTSDYETARRLLDHAADLRSSEHAPQAPADAELARSAARLIELNPWASLPPRERVARVTAIRSIAKKRYDACKDRIASQSSHPELQSLGARWAGADGISSNTTLLRNPAQQDAALKLAFDTERLMQQECGAPSGDDALLLRLAAAPKEASLKHE